MAVLKLLNLLAISCLAVIASLGPTPVAALSVDIHQPRHNIHRAIAAKKRRATTSKRCKPRSTSAPKSTKATSAPKPTKTSNSGSGSTSTGTSGNSGSNSGGDNSGSGAGKVGLAWPMGNDPAIKNFKSWKVSNYYTWSPWCVDDANAIGLKCCPMLWGSKQIGDFTKLVKPGYANCALGYNEPNESGQANMSPEQGASLWWQYLNPLKDQGYYLVSPACTSAPSGKVWMKNFLDNCKGCQIDALALHYYGTDPQEFINYVTDFHNTFGKDIWVTEFACQNFSGGSQCSYDDAFNFMKTVTSWMDSTSYVQKYFAFGAMHDMSGVEWVNQLISSNGQPNALGRLYLGL